MVVISFLSCSSWKDFFLYGKNTKLNARNLGNAFKSRAHRLALICHFLSTIVGVAVSLGHEIASSTEVLGPNFTAIFSTEEQSCQAH